MKLPQIRGWADVQDAFDRLLKAIGPTIKTTGAITVGANFNISTGTGTWVALPGLSFTFKTGPFITRARLEWHCRVDCTVAAWTSAFSGLHVSPAPLSREWSDAVAGAAINSSGIPSWGYLHNAGVIGRTFDGSDTMTLAPNTTYTFQLMGGGAGAAGSIVWAANGFSSLRGVFTPEP